MCHSEVTWMSKQQVKSLLFGMREGECHTAGTDYLSFLQTDRCQGNSLQSVNMTPWMTAMSLQVQANYLRIWGKTGRGLALIGGTLWKSLLCS